MPKFGLYRLFLCVVCLAAVIAGGCGGGANTNQANMNASTPALTSPTPDPCTAPGIDMVIMSEIYKKIDKDFGDTEKLHINATSRNRVVTLKGWADNPTERADVIKIVDGIPCRTQTIAAANAFYGSQPAPLVPPNMVRPGPNGCILPRTQCGEMCIGEGDVCYNQVDGYRKKEEAK